MHKPLQNIVQKNKNKLPRLGFLGIGWIGRNRMESLLNANLAEAAAICDTVYEYSLKAQQLCPDAEIVSGLKEMLDMELDGIVIATPSAFHAEQAIAALESGKAVFCQKPLGRNAIETKKVINSARLNDRLLEVDLSYRYLNGAKIIKDKIDKAEIGKIFYADLIFHNAYGPDKPWFYNPLLSGGGCVIDLGIHLIDLSFWLLNDPEITNINAALYLHGVPYKLSSDYVEDFASVRINLNNGIIINFSCSWRLSAGQDAFIEISFYGSQGSLKIKNINGSFYDFITEHNKWTAKEILIQENKDWGSGAICNWANKLSQCNKYDSSVEHLVKVSEVIDCIYGRKNIKNIREKHGTRSKNNYRA